MNEEAMARVGPHCHRKPLIYHHPCWLPFTKDFEDTTVSTSIK